MCISYVLLQWHHKVWWLKTTYFSRGNFDDLVQTQLISLRGYNSFELHITCLFSMWSLACYRVAGLFSCWCRFPREWSCVRPHRAPAQNCHSITSIGFCWSKQSTRLAQIYRWVSRLCLLLGGAIKPHCRGRDIMSH